MTIAKKWRERLPLLIAPLIATACSPAAGDGDAADEEPRVVGSAPVEALGGVNVVTLIPEVSVASPPPTDTSLVDQLGLDFFPSVLIVRQGQTVEFRNSEVTDHNVNVRRIENDSTLFNVGSVRGDPYYFTFDQEGVYGVACDIHSGMSGTIVVVSTPWAVPVEEDGSFTFTDVPAGSYSIALRSRDPALEIERTVVLGPTGAVTVDLR